MILWAGLFFATEAVPATAGYLPASLASTQQIPAASRPQQCQRKMCGCATKCTDLPLSFCAHPAVSGARASSVGLEVGIVPRLIMILGACAILPFPGCWVARGYRVYPLLFPRSWLRDGHGESLTSQGMWTVPRGPPSRCGREAHRGRSSSPGSSFAITGLKPQTVEDVPHSHHDCRWASLPL